MTKARVLKSVADDGTVKEYPEGIYFNMPFEEYLEIRCLSSTGLKNLLISPTDYYTKSYMNPLGGEIDQDSKAKLEGRAYHKRVLEGKDEFYRVYAADYEDDGDPKMIRTSDELKEALSKVGAKVSFGKKMEGAERLRDADKTVRIMCIEEALHRSPLAGKELLGAKEIRYMEFSARLIECDPQINTYFIGGHPEVSVIFYDEDYGQWFKVRFDYLKVGPFCDFKTFANIMEKEIKRAVYQTMASRKYNIQAGLYGIGNDHGKRLAGEGKVFGYTGDQKWLKAYAETPWDEARWVFQQKGISPVAIGGFMKRDSALMRSGVSKVAEACEIYRRSYAAYGTGMWISNFDPIEFRPDEMPVYNDDV